MGEAPLFQGQTAWFSTSVAKRKVKLWKKNGGLIEQFDLAQFVFSEDAEAPDTKRIFSSEAYFDEHLAVFHAMYILDCLKQDTSKTALGDYFLPPKELHEVIRSQKKLKWEGANDDGATSSSEEEEDASVDASGDRQRERKIHFNGEDYIDIRTLAKITGGMEDLVPGKNGYDVENKKKSKT